MRTKRAIEQTIEQKIQDKKVLQRELEHCRFDRIDGITARLLKLTVEIKTLMWVFEG